MPLRYVSTFLKKIKFGEKRSKDHSFQVVPGGGFEPPTRGFSVLCSTPELPGPLDSKTILDMYFLR